MKELSLHSPRALEASALLGYIRSSVESPHSHSWVFSVLVQKSHNCVEGGGGLGLAILRERKAHSCRRAAELSQGESLGVDARH